MLTAVVAVACNVVVDQRMSRVQQVLVAGQLVSVLAISVATQLN